MKRAILLSVILSIFLVACSQTPQVGTQVNPGPGNDAGKDFNSPKVVDISNFAFNPNEITIKVGETVTWTNGDSAPHTVTEYDSVESEKELDSETLNTGQSYSHTFDAAGTYEYHCAIHTSMTGKVIVE